MADAATGHAWMVAQARRRAAAPALARQPAWAAAGTSTRLGLSHPQTHPDVASTIRVTPRHVLPLHVHEHPMDHPDRRPRVGPARFLRTRPRLVSEAKVLTARTTLPNG